MIKSQDELDREAADVALENEVYQSEQGFLQKPYTNYRFHAGYLAGLQHERAKLQGQLKDHEDGYIASQKMLQEKIASQRIKINGLLANSDLTEHLQQKCEKLQAEIERLQSRRNHEFCLAELEAEKARHATKAEIAHRVAMIILEAEKVRHAEEIERLKHVGTADTACIGRLYSDIKTLSARLEITQANSEVDRLKKERDSREKYIGEMAVTLSIAQEYNIKLADQRDTAKARHAEQTQELAEALRGIIEIGKRDMSNPKYDSYFDFAKEVLTKFKGDRP